MKKIGIITKISKNYGALLQAYALKRSIDKTNNHASVINFYPKDSRKSYSLIRYSWGPKGAITNIKGIINFKKILKGNSKIKKFKLDKLDLVGKYYDNEKICNNPPCFDILITGSDQVWNPINSFDSAYYLDFEKRKNIKLASYAASIGINKIPSKYEIEFIRRIKRMNYISVRENAAKNILASYGVNSDIAPDPTLILEKYEWDSIAIKPNYSEKYILCYFVSYNNDYKKIVEKVKRILGLKVINIMITEESSEIGDIRIRDASPEEFVGYFQNAEFVITSSYHGAIFSIIYNKQFVVSVYKKTSSRVVELLDRFGLGNRIINNVNDNIDSIIDNTINYEDLEQIKNELQITGKKVIDKIIK